MAKDEESQLTHKQVIFCHEYMKDLNGMAAAVRAGYSEKSAKSDASIMLKYPHVKKYVDKLVKQKIKASKITAQTILLELEKLAFYDTKNFFDDEMNVKPVHDLGQKSKAITTIETTTYTDVLGQSTKTFKYKMTDKIKALELMGKHLGFFEKDNEQKTTPTITVTVASEEVKEAVTNLKNPNKKKDGESN